jgi:hypothetical protein
MNQINKYYDVKNLNNMKYSLYDNEKMLEKLINSSESVNF